MNATSADDLDWLERLIAAMKSGATRAEVLAFLGDDGGASDRGVDARSVRPRSKLISAATVYRSPHIEMRVVVEITFAHDSLPTRDALAKHVGSLRPIPRAPDDFTSGDRLVHYYDSPSTKTEVRLIVELDDTRQRVAKLYLDEGPDA